MGDPTTDPRVNTELLNAEKEALAARVKELEASLVEKEKAAKAVASGKPTESKIVGEAKNVKGILKALAIQHPGAVDVYEVVSVNGSTVILHGATHGVRKVQL